MQNDSYVYHVMAPRTRRGTITDGEMENGKMRYIFHLDPRFSDAARHSLMSTSTNMSWLNAHVPVMRKWPQSTNL